MDELRSDAQLIRALADGRVHSRKQLEKSLSLSGRLVSEQVQSLEGLGLAVQLVHGEGYRLERAFELLSEERIRRRLAADTLNKLASLEIHLHTDSTNARLLERPPPQAGHARACLAEYQASGRGRLGRSWQSPFGSGVCLSLSWQFERTGDAFSALGLAAGVAIIDALALCGLPGAMLKWPNDVTWQGRKLAGVLIEMRGNASGPATVVVGVGLNHALTPGARRAIEKSAAVPPTDILEMSVGEPVGRNRVAAALIERLIDTLQQFERQGFAPFIEKWRMADMLKDRPVLISIGNEEIAGIARGIDSAGALLVDADGGQRHVHSGEASLVGVANTGAE